QTRQSVFLRIVVMARTWKKLAQSWKLSLRQRDTLYLRHHVSMRSGDVRVFKPITKGGFHEKISKADLRSGRNCPCRHIRNSAYRRGPRCSRSPVCQVAAGTEGP